MRLSGTKATAIHQYRGLGNQLWDLAGNRPSLDLRFAESKSLVDATTGTNLIDFTRASSGTYVGSDGLIKTATTNYLLQSEDFTTTWSSDGVCTVDPNQTLSPSGTLTADKITVDAGGPNRVSQTPTFQVSAGGTYILSAYIKTLDINQINIRLFLAGSDAYADYAFATNSFFVTNNAIITETGYTSLSDGWTRIFVKYQPTVSGSVNVRFGGGIGGSSVNGSFYIWGAQLEQSSTVGEYIPTTSTINSAPRFDHDPTTGESLGLLVEEQRTNLVTNSSAIGAATGTPGTLPTGWGGIGGATGLTSQVSGIGTENGIPYVDFRFFGTTDNNFLTIVPATGAIGYITNTTYTASIYTKLVAGGIPAGLAATLRIRYNLSPSGSTDITTNFPISYTGSLISNRFFLTGTTTGTLTGTGLMFLQLNYMPGQVVDFTIRVGYPQLEQGAFATSVIPTVGAGVITPGYTTPAVTRAADVASISGSNFSSWYRQDEGTVFAEYKLPAAGIGIVNIDDGTANNNIPVFVGAVVLKAASANAIVAGVNNGRLDGGGSFTANSLTRAAYAIKVADRAFSANGSTVTASATPSTMPVMTQLQIQGATTFTAGKGGTIRRLVYWDQRLPDSTLQGITQQ